MLSDPATRPAATLAVDGLVPREVIRPTEPAALAAAVAAAHQDGLAVVPWGGGAHMGLGNRPARYDLAIELGGLDRVRDHAPADLTLTVEAGATLAAVQRSLAPHGQFLPLDAEDPATATIGGLLAAGVAGPQRAGYGTARDRVLWTEVVAADGAIVRGGAKVVKSVAGYDLPKLHLGALGALGVIVAACFKLQPRPAAATLVLIAAASPDAFGPLLAAIAAAHLAPSVATIVHGDPAWGQPFARGPWVLALGADGPHAAVAWQTEQFQALARARGADAASTLDGEAQAEARQALMTHRGAGEVRLRLVVLPDRLPALLAWLAATRVPPVAVHAEALNGVVHVAWREVAGATSWREAAAIATELGGHWILEACPALWKAQLDIWGPPRPDRALMARLKHTLDPAGTLCPGRSIGG